MSNIHVFLVSTIFMNNNTLYKYYMILIILTYKNEKYNYVEFVFSFTEE